MLDRKPGKGFGYPQQAWPYQAAEAFYRAGRDQTVLWEAFEAASGGPAADEWHRSHRAGLKPRLQAFLRMDEKSDGIFVRSAFERPVPVVFWRGHRLRLPLGLVFRTARGSALRMLWPEKDHGPRSRGIYLVASATLAVADSANLAIDILETWHLRTGETSSFEGRDLRRNYSRLDRLMTATERPAGEPPAA